MADHLTTFKVNDLVITDGNLTGRVIRIQPLNTFNVFDVEMHMARLKFEDSD